MRPASQEPGFGPGTEEAPRRRGWVLSALKIALAGGIIFFLLRRGDIEPSQLKAALGHRAVTFAVLVLMASAYLGQGLRWNVILRDRGIVVPYWHAFRYLMIGKFFNLALPGYLSEDIIRGLYLIRRNGASRYKVLMSLMADRFAGIMSLFLICAAGLFLRYWAAADAGGEEGRLARLRLMTVLITLGAAAFVLIVRRYPQAPQLVRRAAARFRLHHHLDSTYTELHYYCRTPLLQAKLVGLSLLNHAQIVLSFALFGYALGMSQVRLADYCIFVPLGLLVTMIPIAPIGLGVGHLAFLSLFRIAGSSEGANLFSLFTAVCILLNLTGGLCYLSLGRAVEQAPAQGAAIVGR